MVVEPPEKKHAQVKLDLLQGEQVNIKKNWNHPAMILANVWSK